MTRLGPIAVLCVLAACAATASAQWTAVNLHAAGSFETSADGVGGNQQVGYAQLGGTVGSIRASLWTGTAGTWVNLHPAAGVYSFAYAADAGQQVGAVFFGAPSHASLWSGTAGSWVDLNPAGVNDSAAFAVDAGIQVGRAQVLGYHASRWNGTPGSFVDLNPPPTLGYTHTSEAYAIGGGRIGGHVIDVGGVISAALFTGGGWINLHPAGNISSWVYGVDATQAVGVVRVPDTSSHAALWNGASSAWVDLHPVAEANSRATDVAGGMQVGYAQVSGPTFRASLWTGTAASRVDLHSFLPAHFLDSYATSIWISGGSTCVSGYGFNTLTTRREALLWTQVNCYPDCELDGDLDVFDFLCFQGAFAGQAPYADCEKDGDFDVFDFLCFQGLFAGGC